MSINPLIIRNILMVECPKKKKKVELVTCEKCAFCKSIENDSMIERVFCSYLSKEKRL